MNKRLLHFAPAASMIMMIVSATIASADNPTAQPTLEWALNNPDRMTPEVLKRPENAELLKQFKKEVLARPTMNGVVPLLNIGDPDVTRLAIYRYQSRIVGGFPERALAKSSNPDIIPLIGDNLNKIESPDGDEIREDIAVKPLSISSATIIRKRLGSNLNIQQKS